MSFKKSLRYLAVLTLLPIMACTQTAPNTAASGTANAASGAASGASNVASAAAAAPAASTPAAVEATVRKNLAERLPQIPPVEEVLSTPVAGLYEVRVGASDILYTDANGDFLIQGVVLDVKNRKNLTEERLRALSARHLNDIAFDKLPLQDAIVTKKGNGERKIAVFADPNCGYCKLFEKELEKVNNITVYTFLYPILGANSNEKARNIWCAKDRSKVWHSWMVNGTEPPNAQCDDAAINRNLAFGHQNNINGTPAIVLVNGKRTAGAVGSAELEAMLSEAKP